MNFLIPKLSCRYDYIGWFIAIIAVNNIIAITPNFQLLYYAIMAITLLYLMIQSGTKIRFLVPAILLLVVCVVSILFNEIPAFFSPWLRFLLFILVGFLIGPFIFSRELNYFRKTLFISLRWLLWGVTIFSALGHLLGFSTQMAFFGYYNGITTHCNIMGLCAAETIIYISYYFLCNYHHFDYIRKCICSVSIGCALLMLLGSASRAAFLSTLGGLSVLFCFFWKKEQKLLIKILYASLFLLIISYSYWQSTAKILINKNQGIQLNLDTRLDYWIDSWEAFKKSPIIGEGFGGIAIERIEGMSVDTISGHLETGNSWLTLLDMIGLLGAIPFCLLLFRMICAQVVIFKRAPNIVSLLSSILVVSILHMCSEGYIFGAGGIGFFLFWSTLGAIPAFEAHTVFTEQ